MSGGGWHFWIDRGGTFTDVVARDPAGAIHVRKVLSENPEHYQDAPLAAMRDLLGLSPEAAIPPGAAASVKMGTTLATNALLERKGARVVLVTTGGFADLLEIGYQDRPDLFALHIEKPSTLAEWVIEAGERVTASGVVRIPLDTDALRRQLTETKAQGAQAAAILFLHAYAYPEHEIAAGRIAREVGFAQVSLSHEVAKEIKAVGRGDTTAADAYLTPVLRGYVRGLRAALGKATLLRFMQSNGGLTHAEGFRGKNAILSGPAGGVVAYAHLCELAGYGKAIGFDMGGTSTDVSRYDGHYERIYETKVAGVRIQAPMMYIETVAAGGGSILQFDGKRYMVGPESAGANPGPACYGRGGPAAVTDANLVLGRIQPAHFPACFGPRADSPLDYAAAHARLAELADAIGEAAGTRPTEQEAAAGFIRIANQNMVKPIKEISVARGYDVQEYALACFGGAAAQHACAIAAALGMRAIVLHPHAGVLSAYGMGLADAIHAGVEPVLETLGAHLGHEDAYAHMEHRGERALAEEGFRTSAILHCRSADLRYQGTETYINVPLPEDGNVRRAFEEAHQQHYGFTKPGHPIEAVNLRVESRGITAKPDEPEAPEGPRTLATNDALGVVGVWFESPEAGQDGLTEMETPVFPRGAFAPGASATGPALIIEPASTIVLEPGWTARANSRGHLILQRQESAPRLERTSTACDPVMLEVFNNLFMSVATQMGKALERVSHSANIKERLDFSCAVFSSDGALVANAPHIPVHLGAMGQSVRAILQNRAGRMRPGEAYVTNDPYRGGSHLPDITVVTPVFSPSASLLFLVANRGHHADIGGIAPGSMPPFSTSIDEEGIVIHDHLLVSEQRFLEDEMVRVLSAGPYPARNMPERLSDLRAQVAANTAGARLLGELCERHGADAVCAYMGHVRRNAAETMAARLREMPNGEYHYADALDDGTPVVCRITVQDGAARVDFTGTGPMHPGNLNAPPAVVLSAVLYVFRTLIDKPIPLNEGCLDPIEVVIPPDSLLCPAYPAAVVGGNVETSQRICDVIHGALGTAAASQGTMNNLSFGNERFGYYETICGGAGAGPGFAGASGVHTHMTNTRITDPEILEHRYPVLLHRFALRRGSGGAGAYPGGDGVVREMEFLEPMEISVLSERRDRAPFGLKGGAGGKPGRNSVYENGHWRTLPGKAALSLGPGGRLRIATPGGGGHGEPRVR